MPVRVDDPEVTCRKRYTASVIYDGPLASYAEQYVLDLDMYRELPVKIADE